MGQFFEYLKISFKSIWDNKMRSVLTMFGIIVGISSVIMVVSLGNGIKGTITGDMNSLFASQVYIKAGTYTEMYEEAIMTRADVDAVLDNVEGLKCFSMEEYAYVQIVSGKTQAYCGITTCNDTYGAS